MCQQENESYVVYTCAMCGAQETEELGDGNTECLACGLVFSPKNPGMTRVDIAWEIERFLGLIPETWDGEIEDIERVLQRQMAIVSA